jgi:hypothetical protein
MHREMDRQKDCVLSYGQMFLSRQVTARWLACETNFKTAWRRGYRWVSLEYRGWENSLRSDRLVRISVNFHPGAVPLESYQGRMLVMREY